MQDYIGEEFDAVISGVASFGFWAETVAHKCEGMVSLIDLKEIDDFELLEGEYALAGRHTGIRFAVGAKVTVQVMSANLEKRQIDYHLTGMPEQRGSKKAAAKKRQDSNKPKQTARKKTQAKTQRKK